MTKIILILSFLLEGNISLYVPFDTNFFNILFVLSGLILISDLIEDKNKFYTISVITGLLYDLLFINRFGFSIVTFLLSAIFIKNVNFIIKSDIKIIKYITIFIFYRLISYVILLLVGYLTFNPFDLLKSIYSSIILNLGYLYLLKKIFVHQK